MMSSHELLDSISKKIEVNDYSLGNFNINGASSLENLNENTFVFLKKNLESIKEVPSNVIVLIEDSEIASNFENYILTKNCRLAFALSLSIFNEPKTIGGICDSSIISEKSEVHPNSSIGSFVKIDDDSSISENVVIESHCFIGKGVFIGEGTYIKSGAKIGVQGFGFERDSENNPIRIWHSGGVNIGKYCEVGSNTIICSGTIEPTEITNFVKIDDNVHVAHNCKIGDRSMIAGCASIGGSVSIGKDVWIGPNCSIINKVYIGDRANIILGSVVLRNIKNDTTYMKNNKAKFTIE